MAVPAAQTQCPNCGSALVTAAGFSSWCRECSWHLDPYATEQGHVSRVDRMMSRLGEASSASLLRDVTSDAGLRPRLTPSKVALYVLSALVLLLAVGALVLGVALILSGSLV